MKKIRIPIVLVMALYIVYQISPFVDIPDVAIVGMFCLMPFALGWMMVRILKEGTPSNNTFDEQWYEN